MAQRDWIWYNISVNKSKYKIRYNLMGSTFDFSVFVCKCFKLPKFSQYGITFKNKKNGKIKKNVKNAFL